MRKVFGHMEAAQRDLLNRLGISPFDERLRRVREAALHLLEKAWMAETRRDISLSDDELGHLYQACLSKILESKGVHIPRGTLQIDDTVTKILKEVGP